jgi:hypothetical protein
VLGATVLCFPRLIFRGLLYKPPALRKKEVRDVRKIRITITGENPANVVFTERKPGNPNKKRPLRKTLSGLIAKLRKEI